MPAVNRNRQFQITNITEPHLPCVLILDVSASMEGAPIAFVNHALMRAVEVIVNDSIAKNRVEICLITFGSSVKVEVPFQSSSQYSPKKLFAGGLSSLNTALMVAMDEIEKRMEAYSSLDVASCTPWIFLLSDGYPTDMERFEQASSRIHQKIRDKKLNFFPMAVGEADADFLRRYFPEEEEGVVLSGTMEELEDVLAWFAGQVSESSHSGGVHKEAEIPLYVRRMQCQEGELAQRMITINL